MVMVSRSLLLLILLAGTGACHRADYGADGGAIECTVDLETCPAGTTCHLGFCLSDGTALDAGLGVDASQSSDGGEVAADGGRVLEDAGRATAGNCQALFFDGSSRVRIPHADELTLVDHDYTIEAWIKVAADRGDAHPGALLGKNTSCQRRTDACAGYSLAVRSDNIRFWEYFDIGHPQPDWFQGGGPLRAESWVHVAVTYSHQMRTAKIWIDGQSKDVYGASRSGIRPNTADLLIGDHYETFAESQVDNSPFRGAIGPLRISRSVRYDTTFVPEKVWVVDDLTIGYWSMVRDQEGMLVDESANGHHGHVDGAVLSQDSPCRSE